jgi:tRNA 5-methylaminomethyl-2-thiouridine biosynthesis bifunctional protein
MHDAPGSEIFDDIYFSPEDGPAESKYVFLDGNDLPEAFKGKNRFVIAETGFGTGLNFLLAWRMFAENGKEGQKLDYISFEKYPLSTAEIENVLADLKNRHREATKWPRPAFTEAKLRFRAGRRSSYDVDCFVGLQPPRNDEKLARLLNNYPLRVPGFHPVDLGGGVRLILVFDDVNKAMQKLRAKVNAWFLDGFAPLKNPDMWSAKVFSQMARLSAPEATFATFTAAGAVKSGLGRAGFAIERRKGFGKKKHMLTGKIISAAPSLEENREEVSGQTNKKVAIVGAGLAGTACAWLLKKHGVQSVIFEATEDVAGGASGNSVGVFNPRFSSGRSAESDFYTGAYALAIRVMKELQQSRDIGYRRCGSLHLVNTAQKEKRFRNILQSWGWHSDHMRYLDEQQASSVAGVPLHYQALYLPDSGSVSPAALCEAYAEGIDVRLGVQLMMDDIERVGEGWRVLGQEYDEIILACGEGAKWFRETAWLPVHMVRGQIIQAEDGGFADELGCNVCYGGYIAPGVGGVHTLGSTFQNWITHTDILEEDNDIIIGKYRENLPEVQDQPVHAVDARAGLRTTANDHFPIAGTVPDLPSWKLGQDRDVPGLYLTTAHGSHGIVSSIAAATLVTDIILGRSPGFSTPVIDQLNASRFLHRARKKGRMDIYK